MKRIDILADLCDEKVSNKFNKLQKIAADFESILNKDKYIDIPNRADSEDVSKHSVSRIGKSAKDRIHLETEWVKDAGRKKPPKYSRDKIEKNKRSSRDKYHQLRKEFSTLKKEEEVLKNKIQSVEASLIEAREEMRLMNEILQNIDLTNARYAIPYGKTKDDVSYVIDKGKDAPEYHVNLEDGEIITTPWNEYRRSKRAPKEDCSSCNDCDDLFNIDQDDCDPFFNIDQDISDLDLIPGSAKIEDSEPRSETGLSHNLRIIE